MSQEWSDQSQAPAIICCPQLTPRRALPSRLWIQLHGGVTKHCATLRRSGRVLGRRGRLSFDMSAGVVVCLISSIWLLTFFPASAVARIGPGALASTETISYLERTPAVSNHAKHEVAELKSQSIERMDLRIAPQEVDSIFDFRSKIGDGGSNRRGLVGSSPPTCRSKCGTCTPCKPVHVAIGSPHGVISETEYYPEVWRCQCGNRYYMP